MAQPKLSVDGKSDLSVVAGDNVYSLDFFPDAYHSLVDEMLYIFPPLSLMQELKSAHFDDTIGKAFLSPPSKLSEEVSWLQSYICGIQHVTKVEEMKSNCDEAIDNLKLLYSAFRESSDSDNRLSNIDATSGIVLDNASIILCTTCDLLNEVECGYSQIDRLKEAVNEEMLRCNAESEEMLRCKLDKLQIQYKEMKKEHEHPLKKCLDLFKAVKAHVKRHFNYLIDSVVENAKENAQLKVQNSKGSRRDKERELDQLKRQIDDLKMAIEQADQGDTDTQDTALTKLLISLEIMDLHLVYAFHFFTQLGIYAQTLEVTCQRFRSIALGYEMISEEYWMEFKSDVLASNVGWVAIGRLFDEYEQTCK